MTTSLDLEGDLKAIAELKRVLIRGSLLFVVPVGQPHRVERPPYL